MLNEQKKRLPPYISYRTFQHFLEQLERDGIPGRIDRSYWGNNYSGSVGTQLIGGLHFLGLIDANNAPTARLKELVINSKRGQRADVLRQITTNAYIFLWGPDFDAQQATYSQLEELLHRNYQLTDDVARKCIKFFISMAQEAGVTVSPFILKNKRNLNSSTISKKSVRKTAGRTKQNLSQPEENEVVPKRNPSGELLTELLAKFPSLDPNWPDDVKLKWFDAFFELLRRDPGMSSASLGNGNVIKTPLK